MGFQNVLHLSKILLPLPAPPFALHSDPLGDAETEIYLLAKEFPFSPPTLPVGLP